MYNVSSNFKNYIKMPSRILSSRLVAGSTTYTDIEIVDMSLESNLVPGDEFTIGNTICNKFETTLITTNPIYALSVLTPYIGLNINGTVEEVPLGVFNSDPPKVTKSTTKIVAYDNMIKFEKAYFSDLGYPATIQSVATEICHKAGVSFSSMLPSYTTDKIEGKTLREAIGIIAGICGGFARINRVGNLEIVSLTTTDIAITTDNFYGSIEKADKNFTIKKITAIREDNSTISSGSGQSYEEITFSNNYITQAQLDAALTTYNGYSYRPIKFTWQGNPAIDVGDKITITDIDNTVYSIPVMRLKLTYQGGLKSEISSIAKGDSKSEYDYKGPVSKKIERLVIEQANIKVLMAEKANIDYLEANYAHITNGVIDNASIDYAAVNNIAANVAAIADGRIATAKIGAAQISSVDVTSLNAGTIDTAKISLAGPNSRMKITGNRLQVFATKADLSLYERVSIGDVNGDGSIYGLRVRGADGTTILLDETGVKREGITDGSINNVKIAGDANISGTKLDIASVVISINGGSTLIQGSKVFLNNSTLDVQFSNLSQTVNTQGETIGTQTSKINATAAAIGFDLTTQTFINSGLNQRLTATETFINLNSGKITAAVSQTDINNSINAIQIGTRNLVKQSNTNVMTFWSNETVSVGTLTYGTDDGNYVKYTINTSASMSAYRWLGTFMSKKLDLNKDYTVSAEYKTNGVFTRGLYIRNNALVAPNEIFYTSVPNTNEKWQRVSLSFKFTKDFDNILIDINGIASIGSYLMIRNLKIEEGNKASDYTVAPEDTQGQIDSVVSRISTAEVKITPDAIVSTVSKSVMSSQSTSVIIDETDTNITYSGTWASESNINFYGGTCRYSSTVNGYAQYTFVGTGINVYTPKSSGLGICEIFLDGTSKGTIDLYNSTIIYKQKIFSITNLTYGTHVIKIVVTGTKNTSSSNFYVEVDYFEVLNSTAVNGTNIISQINQSAEQIKIAANKITIDGSAIDISANASITSKVNISDLGTLITQNQSSVKVAVGQIGGNNLFKDGSFELGYNIANIYNQTGNWAFAISNGSYSKYPTQGSNMLQCSVSNNTVTNCFFAFNQSITVDTSKKYTLSWDTCWDSTATFVTDDTCVVYWYDSTNTYIGYTYIPNSLPTVRGQWGRSKYTVTPPSGAKYMGLRFGLSIPLNTSFTWLLIDAIKVEEGENATAWSANENELKNASFEVTDQHARFTSPDGSYTEFIPGQTGLKWHKVAGDAGKDYHYLNYSGTTTVSWTNDVIIQLPDEFKNKDVNISVSVKGFDAGSAFTYITNVGAWGQVENKANGTIRISGFLATNTTDLNGNYISSNSYNNLSVSFTVTA